MNGSEVTSSSDVKKRLIETDVRRRCSGNKWAAASVTFLGGDGDFGEGSPGMMVTWMRLPIGVVRWAERLERSNAVTTFAAG